MKAVNYPGIVGSIAVIAGWFSPMLHIPIIGNWNYWSIDTTLALVVMALALGGVWSSLFGKDALLKWISWLTLLLITFTLVAVYFKVNDYFSFIPMKKLAAVAASLVQFKWMGWFLLFAGSIIMIIAGKRKSIAAF